MYQGGVRGHKSHCKGKRPFPRGSKRPDSMKKLEDFFRENNKVALGFSGGVDSAFLLYSGIYYGADICAYYVKSEFQPEFEYEDAIRLADSINANLKVINLSVLDNKEVVLNPQNRCYYCKKMIFGRICEEAKKDGYEIIIDGTNASDDISDRPGFAAITEMKVKSPLRECGLTKDKIRELSKKANLFTWDKPAYACLATRIHTGEAISAKRLEEIDRIEGELKALGFNDFRARTHGNQVKLELREQDFEKLIKKRQELVEILKPFFEEYTVDLITR